MKDSRAERTTRPHGRGCVGWGFIVIHCYFAAACRQKPHRIGLAAGGALLFIVINNEGR
jgi:hypothetical protein